MPTLGVVTWIEAHGCGLRNDQHSQDWWVVPQVTVKHPGLSQISLVVATVFLLTAVAARWDLGIHTNPAVVIASCLVFVAYSMMSTRLPAWGRHPGRRLLLEFVVISVVVWASGGIRSPFRSLYYLFIIEAGIRYLRRGGTLASLAVCASLASIEFLIHTPLTLAEKADDVLASFPFFVAVGVLTSTLAHEKATEVLNREEAERQLAEGRVQAEVVRRELEIAREIQQAVMPASVPRLHGWEFAWRNVPMRAVGGDLVQFAAEGGRLTCAVADVSGKGVPAALLVGSVHQMLDRCRDMPPDAALRHINDALCRSTPSAISVTLAILQIDLASGEVVYGNAGHPYPMVARCADGVVEQWESGDIATGWLDDAEYQAHRNVLHKGEVVLVYTDGLTDALLKSGERLGEEALHEVLDTMRGRPLDEIADVLVTRGASELQTDDVTFLLLRRSPGDPTGAVPRHAPPETSQGSPGNAPGECTVT